MVAGEHAAAVLQVVVDDSVEAGCRWLDRPDADLAEQSIEVEAVNVWLSDLLDAGFDLAEHGHAGAYLDASLSQIGDPLPHG